MLHNVNQAVTTDTIRMECDITKMLWLTKCLYLLGKANTNSFILAHYPLFLLGTNQEDRQLELVVKHHGVNAAGSAEPGCDFIHKVSVKDEEEDA